jgi:hypothetical protein
MPTAPPTAGSAARCSSCGQQADRLPALAAVRGTVLAIQWSPCFSKFCFSHVGDLMSMIARPVVRTASSSALRSVSCASRHERCSVLGSSVMGLRLISASRLLSLAGERAGLRAWETASQARRSRTPEKYRQLRADAVVASVRACPEVASGESLSRPAEATSAVRGGSAPAGWCRGWGRRGQADASRRSGRGAGGQGAHR